MLMARSPVASLALWGRSSYLAAALLLLAGQLTGICPEDCNQPAALYTKSTNTDTVVSYEELKQMLATGSVQLFDVREPEEFEEGSIPGATNVPLAELEQAFTLTPDQFKLLYGVSMPRKSDSDFILHCQRGRRSLTALEIVQALGYTRARHYTGGYSEWEQLEKH